MEEFVQAEQQLMVLSKETEDINEQNVKLRDVDGTCLFFDWISAILLTQQQTNI